MQKYNIRNYVKIRLQMASMAHEDLFLFALGTVYLCVGMRESTGPARPRIPIFPIGHTLAAQPTHTSIK
jgi:hypothetical protein